MGLTRECRRTRRVKSSRPEGPPARSRAREGPYTSIHNNTYLHILISSLQLYKKHKNNQNINAWEKVLNRGLEDQTAEIVL